MRSRGVGPVWHVEPCQPPDVTPFADSGGVPTAWKLEVVFDAQMFVLCADGIALVTVVGQNHDARSFSAFLMPRRMESDQWNTQDLGTLV